MPDLINRTTFIQLRTCNVKNIYAREMGQQAITKNVIYRYIVRLVPKMRNMNLNIIRVKEVA